MPGITGIISQAPVDARAIDRMIACMVHAPFYTSGKYINKQTGISVGWVCHSGSFADGMPIWNGTKDICLIFSGEDFTDLSERQHLRARESCVCVGRRQLSGVSV